MKTNKEVGFDNFDFLYVASRFGGIICSRTRKMSFGRASRSGIHVIIDLRLVKYIDYPGSYI